MRARPAVERLQRYAAPLEGRQALLRLDFNENTLGPSPRVLEALRALPAAAYATYPEYAGLTEGFGQHAGIASACCAPFNGVDAAIRAVVDAFGSPGATFVTTQPTFGYYRPCAELAEMRVVEVPYGRDLAFPWSAMRAELARGPRMCFLCNPNNPTGTLVEPERVLRLAREHAETLFVVDEVYEPFTGKSVLPAATELSNVLTLRSLSKSMGLAALRLGFACGSAPLVERTFRVTGPYDVNRFAVVAGLAALSDPGYVQSYVREVQQAKSYAAAELRQLGLECRGEGGNYLLAWPPGDVAQVEAGLRKRGVLIRSMQGKPVIDGSFRVSIGTRPQMQRFVAALREVLGGSTPQPAERSPTQ